MTVILFEDKRWRLVRQVHKDPVYNKAAWKLAYIEHNCIGQPLGLTDPVWYYSSKNRCYSCETPIPDEMMGLKALVNWER